LSAQKSGTWKLEGALMPGFEIAQKYECIFYDAFSSKTSPHLWQESFLLDFFAKACAANCIVSTYACTGALKRALKASGFEVILLEGFLGKRNRTMGVRIKTLDELL
jgi:tRNA U34 5-methylaminomethyl-2-thiouridine-forming methyltransferase MnmC